MSKLEETEFVISRTYTVPIRQYVNDSVHITRKFNRMPTDEEYIKLSAEMDKQIKQEYARILHQAVVLIENKKGIIASEKAKHTKKEDGPASNDPKYSKELPF